MINISEVASDDDMNEVRTLFTEYWNWLQFEPCFENFDEELSGLPGEYAPPEGCILVATCDGKTAGCVALRKITGRECEMRRLFVRPTYRGRSVGYRLVEEILQVARDRGYRRMRLHTLPRMEKAVLLYESLRFREIPPYTEDPIPGAKYMELEL